ncbi:MAG: FAD-dependent oxidoreductase [Phycisphaerales bacterium]|nr:FAD-dependent oxidoreductase [Phycisphaerales bacterium]
MHETASHDGILRAPELGDEQILRVVCGLRPCRRGGLRIETERIGSIGKTVVHNYGHGGCGVTLGFGTAIEAAGLVEQVAEPGSAVAVLGSGVVGLTSALELLRRGYRVTVFAEKMAPDTTTLLAGALWLPTGIEFGDTPGRVDWFHGVLRASHRRFQEIDRGRFGVERLPIYEPAYAPMEERYFNNGTLDAPVMIDRLPLAGPPRSGKVFHTDFIHTGVFLGVLVEEITRLGGRFVERRFASIDDLGSLDEPVLVNAMAIGSRTVFGDDAMYAARGILVHLKPQELGYCVHDGYKYMFPRRDCLILGGCFLADDWNDQPDDAIAAEIIAHHRRFFGQI